MATYRVQVKTALGALLGTLARNTTGEHDPAAFFAKVLSA